MTNAPPRRDGCPEHAPPQVGGAAYHNNEQHAKELSDEGLVTKPVQLRGAMDMQFKPKGAAKRVGGLTVYPHFR